MHKFYYSLIGILVLIWATAISYYLYTTGDLMLVLLIVANIVLAFRIVIYSYFSESSIQTPILSDKVPLHMDQNRYSSAEENSDNQEDVVILLYLVSATTQLASEDVD